MAVLAGGAIAARGQSALESFDPNANGTVQVVVVQPDGKILIGGDFTTLSPNGGLFNGASSMGGQTRNYIARLETDGRRTPASTTDVTIGNFFFNPQNITISVGSSVRWTNNEGTHTTTSDVGKWDSGILSVGQSFTHTFNNIGDFPYHCEIHPGTMTGTVSVIRAVSRKTHGGAGTFNVNLPLSGTPGIECRSGGSTNDFTMVVTFASNVTVNGNPQAQVTSGTGTIGNGGVSNGGMVTVSGNTVTIPLTNVANAQTIIVTLFGVNDGTNTGNLGIPMGVLLGDTTGNGSVNASDVSQTKSQSGTAASATNFREDVTVSGSINSSDVSSVKAKSGTALP